MAACPRSTLCTRRDATTRPTSRWPRTLRSSTHRWGRGRTHLNPNPSLSPSPNPHPRPNANPNPNPD
eukprot:scaffold32096_cov48-Phaeocystis_antarctica.AAC.3